MAAPTGLAPAGSSTYSSNTLHVGDGTWDYGREDFLLPNLMGLNFDTMRYNGMGNRFAALPEYHTLILGHGILAAITFLFLVPFAILFASFYHRNPHLALRVHISIMAFTVILVTIIFILGYFAVGPERSLTNPHHGIGLAIFILILFQAMAGWIVKTVEKGKQRLYVPIKLMLHQWLGRAIALLAFAQVALGLTLYGSPKTLFILYALWGFFLLVLYFILSYQTHKRIGMAYEEGSYVTATGTDFTHSQVSRPPRRSFSGLEKAAAAIGLGAAVAAVRRRTSDRHKRHDSGAEMLDDSHLSSQTPPPHHRYDDRFTESQMTDATRPERTDHTWRNRLLGGAAGLGGLALLKSKFGRRRREDEYESDVGPYPSHPHHPYDPTVNSSVQRINNLEEGIPNPASQYTQAQPGAPPASNHYMSGAAPDWQRMEERERLEQARMNALRNQSQTGGEPRHHDTNMSEDAYTEYEDEKPHRESFGNRVLGGLGGLAAFGGIRNYMQRRRSRREQAKPNDYQGTEAEDDRLYSQGAATPGSVPTVPYTDDSPVRPRPTGQHTTATGSPSILRFDNRTHDPSIMSSNNQPIQNIPPPPSTRTGMAPPPPIHQDYAGVSPVTSFESPPRSHPGRTPAGMPQQPYDSYQSGSPSRYQSTERLAPPRMPAVGGDSSRPNSQDSAIASPPVSVKMTYHNDGRHVTLRRLGEEEAARERESRRRERLQASSAAAQPGPSAYATQTSQAQPGASSRPPYPSGPTRPVEAASPPASLHAPQPPFAAGAGGSGVHSPGRLGSSSPLGPMPASSVGYETGGSAAPSDYETNRRRRRAERARLAQQQGIAEGNSTAGQRVDFA